MSTSSFDESDVTARFKNEYTRIYVTVNVYNALLSRANLNVRYCYILNEISSAKRLLSILVKVM